MEPVLVVSTGTANVASMVAGLRRAGATAHQTNDADAVARARRVVVPGVGTFAAAMQHLEHTGVADALRERVAAGRPLLAVCLGLQLLAEASEESPGVVGLGVLRSAVGPLPSGARVPQLGWNHVDAPGDGLMRYGYAYFANSFCLAAADDGWTPSYADHGGRFIAAIERDAQLACQFHPELSGAWGTDLITRWVQAC